MYLGISDIETEGQFKTIDGTPIDEIYHKWNWNQPDNYNNNEHCLHMYSTGNYNDVPCSSAYSFICKKSLLSPERNIQHNLSSVIGAPLDTSMTNTKLIIELESFDNNTTLNAVPKKFFTKYNLWSKKIILPPPPIEFVKNNIITTLNYSETTDVPYSCQDYMSSSKKTFTALITKENKIKTFNETQTLPRKFKMADNGSILCCLYYDYKSNDVKEMQITRFVVNKKLLIFSVQNLKPGGPESQPSVVTDSYDYSWIIYVSATLIAVSILVLALYYISRQGWFKNPQPVEETVELDNQADQNQVLYANLDFVNAANRLQRNQTEEPHYASIVGVLHPH
ncbi:hypothetical protein PYW07_011301 [Mythimna separata]|uniref:C-type lectin domain-containing protein n=1 Tax=Mythimna separata TaxID=271217 RepID=A0AAD8DLW8_MYTSE|nr:hypothetical protein PYW07_011301 [Mythimna separata]